MSLYKEWNGLLEGQTDKSFKTFWEKYSSTEQRIYQGILKEKNTHVSGIFKDLAAQYEAEPAIFMGFLDGIQTSIKEPFNLESITEDSEITLDIIWDKLFYNMINADADYLYSLEEWKEILTEEEMTAIADQWRRSRTVVKEKLPGRNDPCPCGSGKKYKKCCGKDN